MPWERKTVVEKREDFVEAVQRQEETVSALCREYGISRKTGYKWLQRAAAGESLEDRSHNPHRKPGKTAQCIEQQVLEMRETHPAWGGKMIHSVLEASGTEGLPSPKTCCNILKRNGYISQEEAQKHKACQRFQRGECNQLWQMDFKGDFQLKDGSRCFPLDILDDHSRYCLCVEAKSQAQGVQESVLRVLKEYGMPDAILSDHGAQFAGFHGGYSKLERFLIDLDIEPIHGRIKHPQTQGKIERFHRTMKAEALRSMPENLEAAQRQLKEWQWEYNHIRPHSALSNRPPASEYRKSERPYSPPKAYEYAEGAHITRINNWGYLRFGPIQLYLSETMKNTDLEIRPMAGDGEHGDGFAIIYRNYRIAIVDAETKQLRNRIIRRL